MKKLAPLALGACVILAGCDSHQREVHYLDRGQAYFDKGDYAKALLEYKNAARIAPVDPEPFYRMGLIEESLLNIGVAYGDFLHAAELNKHYLPALLKIANYDLAGNQIEDAQLYVTAALTDAPDDAEARALNGALLLRRKDYEKATSEARFALAQDPKNITAYSVLTGVYFASNDLAQAGKTIDEGVAKNPGDLSLLLLKAKIYEQAGNFAEVEAAYQSMFALKPDYIQLRVDLATIYINANRLDDAERTLREAVKAKPDDMGLRHQLVQFLGDHRDMDAAEAEIHEDMKAFPDKDDFYFWLADLYNAHNAPDKAIALLQQIIAQNPSETVGLNARTSMARINFIRGNKELAQQLVDAVLARQPTNNAALFVRANLAYDRGDYQNAIADLRVITHDDPNNGEAKKLLAETLLHQNYLDLAIETLNQLTEAKPEDISARVRLAQMYALEKNYPHALELANAIAAENPTYGVAWETIARIALEQGDYAMAQSAIDHLESIDGQQMTATYLQGQMVAKQGDSQNAIDLYTKVIDADPTSPLAEHSMNALVEASDKLGKTGDANAYIDTLKGKSAYAETLLAESFIRQGKFDEAKAALDDAIAHDPRDQQPYIDRARLYLGDHQPDQAIDILAKGAAALPVDLRASMLEADVTNQLGHYDQATQIYDDILKRSPGMDLAANNLAAMIADYQFTDPAALAKAHELAQRFANSQRPELLDTFAWVAYRQGNADTALGTMHKIISLKPDLSPEMHYHYGAILLKAGKTAEAKDELTKAIAAPEPYPGIYDARALLAPL